MECWCSCFRHGQGLLCLNVDDARPLESGVLELDVANSGHLISSLGVSEGVGNYSAAPYLIVERVVDVAMEPEVGLL